MKEYYKDDFATIYHGDALEILPKLSLPERGVVVTDPPYGIKRAKWDYSLPIEWFWIAKGLIEPDGAAYIFGDRLKISRLQIAIELCGIKWKGRASWIYEDGPRSKQTWTSKHEDCLIWFASEHKPIIPREESIHKDKRWGNDRGVGDVWKYARVLGNYSERVGHETQKPLDLIKMIISASNMTILDPFMGSGTTLVAAKQLNRKSIGIEIEERYCQTAAERLSQEVLNFDFTEKENKE